ncbi:Vanillate O-demethylase oxygenase subunit [hydrothermal vent metagenome]|uniref:Vanillate O-demethylase oxygenase subunit n=1 Tax=hydrothermal vent metagenome TaxID=652676 RepID=A0A3B0SF83_9ZZZZ
MILSELWYFGAFGQQIEPGEHLHVELAGQPLFIGRDFAGQAFAVRDICPHRGILLSTGKLIQKKGQTSIECPYHGWRFGTDGRCVAIPSLTREQAKTKDVSKIATRGYPVRERQGLIWVYIGENQPDMEPITLDLVGETAPKMRLATQFDCHVDHAVIGLMDPAHIAYIHRQWWWRTEKSMHEKAKQFGPVPFGFSMLPHTPSANSFLYRLLGAKPETEIRFQLPGIRVEYIKVGDKYVVGFTAVTPINETSSRISIGLYWDHPVVSLFPKWLIRKGLSIFVGQDRDAVNAQQKGLAYNPDLMLIHDADVQAKWYFALKKAWLQAQKTGAPFQNPVQAKTLKWRS